MYRQYHCIYSERINPRSPGYTFANQCPLYTKKKKGKKKKESSSSIMTNNLWFCLVHTHSLIVRFPVIGPKSILSYGSWKPTICRASETVIGANLHNHSEKQQKNAFFSGERSEGTLFVRDVELKELGKDVHNNYEMLKSLNTSCAASSISWYKISSFL